MSFQGRRPFRFDLSVLMLAAAVSVFPSCRYGENLHDSSLKSTEIDPAGDVSQKPLRRATVMDEVLEALAEQEAFSIVQIGAYVGDTGNDPLFPFLSKQLAVEQAPEGIKVVLVEPIKEYFDQLVENYANMSGIDFENVAIAETEGECEMFRLDVDPADYGYPAWLAQLSSLKKERMEELWEALDNSPEYQRFYLEHRIVETVKCFTLHQLLDKHRISELDLLQIDAEGYDFEILKTLDFNKIRPRYINYERVLLQDDEKACRNMLSSYGYRLVDWGQDTLAVRDDHWQDFTSRRKAQKARLQQQVPDGE